MSTEPIIATALESFGPLEVIEVRRHQPDLITFLYRWLFVPLDGLLLMLAVPLAHKVLGTPDVHPGYWPCLLLLVIVDQIATRVLHPLKPLAS